jgi:hypothetical protein
MTGCLLKSFHLTIILTGLMIIGIYLLRRDQVVATVISDYPAWLLWGLYLLYGAYWLLRQASQHSWQRGVLVFALLFLPLSCYFVLEGAASLVMRSPTFPLWLPGGLMVLQGGYWLISQTPLSREDIVGYSLLMAGPLMIVGLEPLMHSLVNWLS